MTTILPPVPQRSNPLAPAWMLPSFDLPRCSQGFTYAKTFTIPAGTELPNQLIHISQDAAISVYYFGFSQTTAGADDPDLAVRFRDGEGKRLSEEYCNYLDLAGPVLPMLQMAAGTNFGIDFKNTSASSITVQVILKAIKRGRTTPPDPAFADLDQEYLPLWRRYSAPEAGQVDRSFEYYFELDVAGSAVLQSYPLPLDDDADFYLRGFAGAQTGGQIRFSLTDHVGNLLSSGAVLDENYFDTQQGGTLFPELYCPLGSVLLINGVELSGSSTVMQICLKGVKRYQI